MARPRDAVSPAWDALAPVSGWDALATPSTDALSATYEAPSVDALAVGSGTDALAAGYRPDALAVGDGSTGDPLAAPVLGDTFGDPLTTYGDATGASPPDTGRVPDRRAPRPGPVAPQTPDDASVADSRPTAGVGRPVGGRPVGGRPESGRPRPDGRRARQPGSGRTSGTDRSRSSGTGSPTRSGSPGSVPGRTGSPNAGGTGGGSRPTTSIYGQSGTGGGGSPYSGGARGSRSGAGGPVPTAAEAGRTGAQGVRQGPGWGSPWWANQAGRPTGTVPWAAGSGRSGWDEFFTGMGGTGGESGKQPSGTDVARALLAAFRRNMRDR